MLQPAIITAIGFLFSIFCFAASDYYQLLGVAKDADERTIRRAFKKLAIQKHPDKDSDNPNAHDEFIKINKAYEVLKDPDLRRRYDQFGEEGLKDENKHWGQKYQSWDFYNDKFGIYDEDLEIVTLSRTDFQRKVVDSGDFWFINFYSTYCSHCHDLAPTWREFARKMEGIVKIGAVNCAEDPHLCQSQNVMGYPSLVVYPDHVFYHGQREVEALVEFVTSRMRVELIHLTAKNLPSLSNDWEPYNQRPWVVDFCDEMDNCLSVSNRRMLAQMLGDTANIATVNCHSEAKESLCESLRSEGIAFYPVGKIAKEAETEIPTLDLKEIHKTVLELLPEIPKLSAEEYRTLLDNVEERRSNALLILFGNGEEFDSLSVGELKKLQNQLDSIEFRRVDCSEVGDGCEGLRLGPTPKLVFFRSEGHYLISYAKKITLSEAKSFIHSAQKSQMISLNERLIEEIRSQTAEMWIVDYFAPWCNPCMSGLAELENLPHEFNNQPLRVGIIDCDVHKELCKSNGIGSYPTTMLLSPQSKDRLVGFHGVDAVIDFLHESLHPSAIELTPQLFEDLVHNRAAEEIFVVDFFAPWCGPCQQLAPEFRKLARIVQEETEQISFGTVDCEANRALCQQNGVNRYPTVRLYGLGADGTMFDYPSNWWRDHTSMRQWVLQFLPTNVIDGDAAQLDELMNIRTDVSVVIDFFAPWCSHCVQFAPIYDHASRMMEKENIVFVKVDCTQHPNECAKAAVSAYPTIKLYTPGRRQLNNGVRLHAQDSIRLVDIIRRVLGQYVHQIRDEL